MFGWSSKIYQGMSFQELHSVPATKKAGEFSYFKQSKQNALFNLSGLITSQASRMILIVFIISVPINKYHLWILVCQNASTCPFSFLRKPLSIFHSFVFSNVFLYPFLKLINGYFHSSVSCQQKTTEG